MMASVLLTLLALVTVLMAVACGFISMQVLAATPVERGIAFGWGLAFGPVGIGVALYTKSRHRRIAAGSESPW
jgi:hypothetical protein